MMIYIVRHAWAGEGGDPAWPDDRLRPLTPAGQERFRVVAARLAGLGVQPLSIATSPLVRCRQTAELLAEALPHSPPITELDALAPDSSLDPILDWTRQQAGDVAWVGHAPDVGQLVADMVNGSKAAIHFAKGAAAAIEIRGRAVAGRGQLCWLTTAKLLQC